MGADCGVSGYVAMQGNVVGSHGEGDVLGKGVSLRNPKRRRSSEESGNKRVKLGLGLGLLPTEILLQIMLFLSCSDLANLGQVNHRMYDVSQHPYIVEETYKRELGGPIVPDTRLELAKVGNMLHKAYPLRHVTPQDRRVNMQQRVRYGLVLHYHGLVRKLLSRGVRISTDMMILPIYHNNLEGLRCLIAQGGRTSICDQQGRSLLWHAACVGNTEIAQFLLDHVPVSSSDMNGVSALHAAAASGHTAVMELLIAAGAPIEKPCFMFETPLFCAVESQCVEAVQVLINHGANVTCFRLDGSTPLHVALSQPDFRIVELLLNEGADPHQYDWNGDPPPLPTHPFSAPAIAT